MHSYDLLKAHSALQPVKPWKVSIQSIHVGGCSGTQRSYMCVNTHDKCSPIVLKFSTPHVTAPVRAHQPAATKHLNRPYSPTARSGTVPSTLHPYTLPTSTQNIAVGVY